EVFAMSVLGELAFHHLVEVDDGDGDVGPAEQPCCGKPTLTSDEGAVRANHNGVQQPHLVYVGSETCDVAQVFAVTLADLDVGKGSDDLMRAAAFHLATRRRNSGIGPGSLPTNFTGTNSRACSALTGCVVILRARSAQAFKASAAASCISRVIVRPARSSMRAPRAASSARNRKPRIRTEGSRVRSTGAKFPSSSRKLSSSSTSTGSTTATARLAEGLASSAFSPPRGGEPRLRSRFMLSALPMRTCSTVLRPSAICISSEARDLPMPILVLSSSSHLLQVPEWLALSVFKC